MSKEMRDRYYLLNLENGSVKKMIKGSFTLHLLFNNTQKDTSIKLFNKLELILQPLETTQLNQMYQIFYEVYFETSREG